MSNIKNKLRFLSDMNIFYHNTTCITAFRFIFVEPSERAERPQANDLQLGFWFCPVIRDRHALSNQSLYFITIYAKSQDEICAKTYHSDVISTINKNWNKKENFRILFSRLFSHYQCDTFARFLVISYFTMCEQRDSITYWFKGLHLSQERTFWMVQQCCDPELSVKMHLLFFYYAI